MIKKTLYFGNPVYLSLKNAQLVIKLPEVVKISALPEGFKQMSEVTKPIEDIGVVVLDNKQITITSGVLEALLENNCAVITCDSKSMPVGLMLPLYGNTTQNERFRHQLGASLPLMKHIGRIPRRFSSWYRNFLPLCVHAVCSFSTALPSLR